MDWIDVVVDAIDIRNVPIKNDNDASVNVIAFIHCIDILWESIKQLHRVFFNIDDIPFSEETTVFREKIFEATDNDYFKTIRACFAAHPVNLGHLLSRVY